ncbi:hypothetical protein TorRG33x02_023740, partial [Trema orientale]
EFLQLCKDDDHLIIKLGLLSFCAVFKDIILGYNAFYGMQGVCNRIRLLAEKELQLKVFKDVKKMGYYESTLYLHTRLGLGRSSWCPCFNLKREQYAEVLHLGTLMFFGFPV